MKQIRRGVFETNSSSCHSLVIRSNELMEDLEESVYFTHDEMLDSLGQIKDGKYQSRDEDWYFGRSPFRALDTFELRFQYAYANYYYDDDKLNGLVELLKELVPEVKSIKKPEYAGVDERRLDKWLAQNNISLQEFLTNKKYVVIQDGDEYCIWYDLVQSGLIDTKMLDNGKDVENNAKD